MSERRYDVWVNGDNTCTIEPHFCRDLDCFGTNPDHGMTFEEAKQEVIDFYAKVIEDYKQMKEEDLFPPMKEY